MPLRHSEIREGESGYVIEVADETYDLTVNGDVRAWAPLKVGDELQIGPYRVEIEETPSGKDLALSLELARPLGDDFAELQMRSKAGLGGGRFGKRGWAWIGFAAALALCIILPLGAFFLKAPEPPTQASLEKMHGEKSWLGLADTVWLSGGMSGPHRYFGDNCEACHFDAFVQVRDAACIECHKKALHHADPQVFKTSTFEDYTCAKCHKEHNGIDPIVLDAQAFCVSCHEGLKEQEPETTLINASDFLTDHPEFRPTIVTDVQAKTWERISLDSEPGPVEKSNLVFPHWNHMVGRGVRNAKGETVKMVCQDCHVPEPGGGGMENIVMETHCAECHPLNFEPKEPERMLPHGDPLGAITLMREYYARKALAGEVEDRLAPAIATRRRIVGDTINADEGDDLLSWAQEKAAEVAGYYYGRTVCGNCHEIDKPSPAVQDLWENEDLLWDEEGDEGVWDVKPVKLAKRWMPKGLFDHASHAHKECVFCHEATESRSAQDVLMPSIEICQACHGGDNAEELVPSTCITCHEFHQPCHDFQQPCLPPITASGAQVLSSVSGLGN